MTLEELKEQLQENIRTEFDVFSESTLSDICQVVVDTFNNAFYADAPQVGA